MKISFSRCLFIIFCVQLLITSTLCVQNKLSSSSPDTNLVHHAATTVLLDIDPREDNSKAGAEVKNMIGISKKSQGGKIGSGGGNNVVHGEKKNDAASTLLPQSLCFYISVCLTFSLLVWSDNPN